MHHAHLNLCSIISPFLAALRMACRVLWQHKSHAHVGGDHGIVPGIASPGCRTSFARSLNLIFLGAIIVSHQSRRTVGTYPDPETSMMRVGYV